MFDSLDDLAGLNERVKTSGSINRLHQFNYISIPKNKEFVQPGD